MKKEKLKKQLKSNKKDSKKQKKIVKIKKTIKIKKEKKKAPKKQSKIRIKANKKAAKKILRKRPGAKKQKHQKTIQTKPADKNKKDGIPTKKLFNKSPVENLSRPFNIIESYMGDYSFSDIYSILFVCTGNMCRSPIAEGLLKKKISEEAPIELKDKMFVHSCGIYAYDGNKPSENSVKVSVQNMVDISLIRSKPINRVQIEQSDLIFALSIDHLNFILENFPSAKHKTFLLKTYGKDKGITIADSIPDPMGFSMEFYIKTFTEIKNAIDSAFSMMVAAAQQKIFQKSNLNS